MGKLNIGLLLEGKEIDKYVLDLLHWAGEQDSLDITAAIIWPPAPARRSRRTAPLRAVEELLSALFFRLVLAIEGLLIRVFGAHRTHLARYRLIDAAPGCAVIDLRGEPVAAGARRVADAGLDLLVRLGPGAASAELAGAAPLGIVALDFHGKRACQRTPPAFWEASARAPKTEFEIRHEAGNGLSRVLAGGSFRTKFFFLLNQAYLYSQAGAQLKSLLRTVAATRCLPPGDRARPYSGPHLSRPRWYHSLAYLGRLGARLGAKAFYKVFNFQEKWGISCIDTNWKDAALWNSTRISAPRGHFWADPFLCQHNGKTYCFVEDYVYKTRRGHISALEITAQGARFLGDCIREDFHMSFPFLFRYQGELYMCPETSQARQVRIYRCKNFPLEWELCSVAMDGISAADSMFFEHGGKWWMLTNIDRSGLNDHCSELCLFYASSPFDASWTAHPQNPLRVDADGGRNAGLILEDNRIFRAAQRQGFDQYGKGLAVHEIVVLNEQVYVEKVVSELDCGFRNGLLGSHHMSTTGKITVVDHVDRCFFP